MEKKASAEKAVRFAYRPFPRSLAATRLFEDTRSREVGDPRITCDPAAAGKLVVLISMQESSLSTSTSVGEVEDVRHRFWFRGYAFRSDRGPQLENLMRILEPCKSVEQLARREGLEPPPLRFEA